MQSTNTERFETLQRVRVFARYLMRRDVPAEEVGYALAYIASELGLALNNRAEYVYPVVLSAITHASVNHLKMVEEEEAEEKEKADNSAEQELKMDVVLH